MNKLLFMTFVDLNNKNVLGISKKVKGQVAALEKKYKVSVIFPSNNYIYILEKGKTVNKIHVNKGLDNYRSAMLNILKNKVDIESYTYSYFRNISTIDNKINEIFKYLSLHTMLILEIPTYPFDKEIEAHHRLLSKKKRYIELLIKRYMYYQHKNNIKKLHKYVSLITTFNPIESIWNIEVVSLENGIDTEKIEMRNQISKDDNILILVTVGNLQPWHGLERLINSIDSFEKNNINDKKILLKIIGEGSIRADLENLVKEKNLEKSVIFLGPLSGEALEKQYAEGDLGVGSLGLYKLDLDKASPLKTKEYFAYGLPFIYGYTESELLENSDYTYKVSNDASNIDIGEVINFFTEIKGRDNYRKEMNTIAKKYLTWDAQFDKLIKRLKE